MKTDYRVYKLKRGECILCCIIFLILVCSISILFFNSWLFFPVLLPLVWFLFKDYIRTQANKRERKLVTEFKEMIMALAANMEAGYSLERACYMAADEMKSLYQGSSYIEQELAYILHGLEMNENIEALLADFGERSGNGDIMEFAQVVAVAKRSGGNLIRIVKKSAYTIGQKIEVENEIDTTVTAKRLEQRIMSLMPFGIILYLRIANQGYMDILYETVTGRIVMTVCLVLVGLATVWGEKIVKIEV